MKVEKEMKMRPTYADLVKEFVDLSYKVYGSYAHSSGYLQSLTANLMDGYADPKSAARMLKESIVQLETRLNYEEREKQFEMMSRDVENV
jgi:hypothetical protein